MMNKTVFFRVIYNIVVLLSLLFASWLGTLFLCLVGLILFRNYYECILVGVAIDMLYGMPHDRLMNTSVMFTSAALVLFAIVYGLKKRVRFHE